MSDKLGNIDPNRGTLELDDGKSWAGIHFDEPAGYVLRITHLKVAESQPQEASRALLDQIHQAAVERDAHRIVAELTTSQEIDLMTAHFGEDAVTVTQPSTAPYQPPKAELDVPLI